MKKLLIFMLTLLAGTQLQASKIKIINNRDEKINVGKYIEHGAPSEIDYVFFNKIVDANDNQNIDANVYKVFVTFGGKSFRITAPDSKGQKKVTIKEDGTIKVSKKLTVEEVRYGPGGGFFRWFSW